MGPGTFFEFVPIVLKDAGYNILPAPLRHWGMLCPGFQALLAVE